MEQKIYPSKILHKTSLANDTICLKLEKPEGFKYKAGQFAQIEVTDTTEDKKILRPYSICSVPQDEYLEFCIKIVPDGKATTFLNNTKEGQEINVAGPMGHFVSEEETASTNFIATGVGIAPIIGIIVDQLKYKNNKEEINLLFGLRFDNDIFLTEKLDNLVEEFPNFKYQITLSKPSEQWKGLQGRVTDHLPKKVDEKTHFYICGNPAMVGDVRKDLAEKGVLEENIHFEMF